MLELLRSSEGSNDKNYRLMLTIFIKAILALLTVNILAIVFAPTIFAFILISASIYLTRKPMGVVFTILQLKTTFTDSML